MSDHRFFAPPEAFSEETVTLTGNETRHLRSAVRLGTGSKINIFDGNGNEFIGTVRSTSAATTVVHLLERVLPASPESPLSLTMAVALTKSDKFDLVVQKLVELGVSRIIPMQTRNSDVRLKDPRSRSARWERIALEAAKQCGRARLTAIEYVQELGQVVAATEPMIAFSERSGDPFSSIPACQRATALIGPEGGWDDAELGMMLAAGAKLVTLGGRLLRAETAAIAAATLLQHSFGDLG